MYNNIYANAKMTTLISKIQICQLKQLLNNLKREKLNLSLPFFLIKTSEHALPLSHNTALTVTRQITNMTLARHRGPLSVWSPAHLQRIRKTKSNWTNCRMILKNPFKSYELIEEALSMGVSEMVIDSLEEYSKIQTFLKNSLEFKQKHILYHWLVQHPTENLADLLKLKNKVGGIVFPSSVQSPDELALQLVRYGVQISHLTQEVSLKNLKTLSDWRAKPLAYAGKHIQKTVEITDVSEVDNYILAAPSLTRGRTMFDRRAQQLVQEGSEMIISHEKDREEWLFSRIKQFPMDEDKYIFEVSSESKSGLMFAL